jgi:hypothetical protein
LLPVIMIMSSSASLVVFSGSAVRRPRLRVVVVGFGCGSSGAVEEEAEAEDETEDVGERVAVFVRELRCLMVDCFVFDLVFVLVGVTLAVRDKGGSEPIVAMVEVLLSEEREDVLLVVDFVDPMVAIVEVLVSAEGLRTELDADAAAEMEDSISAMAYVL